MVEEFDRIGWRNRPVVEITSNNNKIDVFVPHQIDEPVDEECLLIEQPVVAKRTPEVPVTGMQNSHVSIMTAGYDSVGDP